MIVNHATGEAITLRALRLQFPSIAAPGNPAIGTNGIRTAWADESAPTDAELRLIGYSLLVETEKPTPGEGEQVRQGPHEKIDNEWRQAWIVEPTPVVVPDRVESHKIKMELSSLDLRSTVDSIISSADQDVKDAFYAPYYHRDSLLISQFAQLLGLTDEQIDGIFIDANKRIT